MDVLQATAKGIVLLPVGSTLLLLCHPCARSGAGSLACVTMASAPVALGSRHIGRHAQSATPAAASGRCSAASNPLVPESRVRGAKACGSRFGASFILVNPETRTCLHPQRPLNPLGSTRAIPEPSPNSDLEPLSQVAKIDLSLNPSINLKHSSLTLTTLNPATTRP